MVADRDGGDADGGVQSSTAVPSWTTATSLSAVSNTARTVSVFSSRPIGSTVQRRSMTGASVVSSSSETLESSS